jgi:hypothetical protein
MTPAPTTDETDWAIDYDVEPIRIRDPVAEALAVLEPGDPFVVSYRDVVKTAGHSCPTAAGAFRITQVGLDALYPDSLAVRSDIEVRAGGPKDDASYGVAANLVAAITGAAESDGFGGLAGGYGGRDETLSFGTFGDEGVQFAFRRTDTDETVVVTYRVADIPKLGPEGRFLPKLVDGSATDEERDAFATAWHSRVQTVLDDDALFDVERVEAFPA